MEIGDTVRLKSGSELMTIMSIDQNEATCTWMLNGEVKTFVFPLSVLEEDDGSLPFAVC